MLVKIHQSYREIVAVCDSNLIGKKFEQGQRQLDLTGNFFRGEDLSEERVRQIIQKARQEDATFNIVGEKACALCKQCNLIKESGIIRIKNIPVALVLL